MEKRIINEENNVILVNSQGEAKVMKNTAKEPNSHEQMKSEAEMEESH